MFFTQAFDTCRELSIPSYILFTASALFLAYQGPCFKVRRRWWVWVSCHCRRVPMASISSSTLMRNSNRFRSEQSKRTSSTKRYLCRTIFPIGLLVKETELVCKTKEECMAWLDKQFSESAMTRRWSLFVKLIEGGVEDVHWCVVIVMLWILGFVFLFVCFSLRARFWVAVFWSSPFARLAFMFLSCELCSWSTVVVVWLVSNVFGLSASNCGSQREF